MVSALPVGLLYHTNGKCAARYVVVSYIDSQVGLLQTAHYWANAGVLLDVRMRRE